MNIKVYGTRGGIPSTSRKGFSTERYGGDTTHLRFEVEDKFYFIDGGTGIAVCGDELLEQGVGLPGNLLDSDIFVSHYHWDHVQGFPFFAPFHIPGNKFRIYGMGDSEHVKRAMIGGSTGAVNHGYCEYARDNPALHFPVSYDETQLIEGNTPVMAATKEHFNIYEYPHDGLVNVRATPTKHPGGCLALRFYSGEKNFVFGGDHEFGLDSDVDRNLVDLCRGSDLIIMDAQYKPEEYEKFRGWGHSHFGQVIDFARYVGAKRLGMTHHDRKRSDGDADLFLENAEAYRDANAKGLDVFMLKPGLEIKA